jgi:hypothetical protein
MTPIVSGLEEEFSGQIVVLQLNATVPENAQLMQLYDSPCEKANCFSGWMNRSNNDIIVEYFNNVEICGFGCENGNPFNSNRVKSLELNSLFSFE